jgi:hypothetical protein
VVSSYSIDGAPALVLALLLAMFGTGCGGGASADPHTGPPSPGGESVDTVIANCPTAAEVAAFDSDLSNTIIIDSVTWPTLVCTAASGSADLNRLQERLYQALRVMKKMPFDAPLPWTEKPLYDWFVTTVKGVRFRDDIDKSFCCDPVGVINIRTIYLDAFTTTRWISPSIGEGLDHLVILMVHEARHIDGGAHTCFSYDQDISELKSWGVEYYLDEWMALHTGSFLTPALSAPSPRYYRDIEWDRAQAVRDNRFCNDPDLLVSPVSVDFAEQSIQTPSLPRTIAVTAGARISATVSSVHIAGDTADFALKSTTCGNAQIPPSCIAIVAFAPQSAGPKAATLEVDGPSGRLFSVPLTGTGVSLP